VTSSSATDIEIAALDRAEIRLESWSWPLATERREDVAAYFAALQRERSGVWNGRVLLMNAYALTGSTLRGACFETDYANLCAWREWNFPGARVYNFFGAAALGAADGAYLVGEMAPSTANAGLVTFPCGTPEPNDVGPGGVLDLDGGVGRELLEETGIDIGELNVEPGWLMVRDGGYLALVKHVTSRQSADELRARIIGHLAREQRPEFTAIRIVRSPADFDPAMPRFVSTFLAGIWS
jgi:hypothetical protein